MVAAFAVLLLIGLVPSLFGFRKAGPALVDPGCPNAIRDLPAVSADPGGLVEPARLKAEALTEPDTRYSPHSPDGWLIEILAPAGNGQGEAFEPVPLAELCFFCPNLVEDYDAFLRIRRGWFRGHLPLDEGYRALGRVYRADALGRVRVPRPIDPGAVAIGWKEDLWGQVALPPNGFPPFRLVLRPDVRLEVQVVDEWGRPASGVPVSLWGGDLSGRLTLVTPPLYTAGPEGIARFHRIRELLQSWKDLARRDGNEPALHVQLELPLAAPVREALDPARLPADPVRLVLPPTGAVVVEAAGFEKLPPGGGIRAGLRWRGPEGEAGSDSRIEVDAVGGIAVFPRVGLGLELTVHVRWTLHGVHTLSRVREQVGHGPTMAGEEVRFRFPDESGFPLLAGRVVGERGEPAGSRVLDFTCFRRVPGDEAVAMLSTQRTDGQGRFLVPFPLQLLPECRQGLLVATRPDSGEPPLQGCLELPSALEPGLREIGSVVLRPPRLVAAGRVLDRQGRPLPMSRVGFFFPSARASGRPLNPEFPQGRIHALLTDAEGRFSFCSPIDLEEVLIVAATMGRLPIERVERTVPAGTAGLELVPEAAAILEGSLLLPEGATSKDIRLLARYTDRPGVPDRHGVLLPDGRFLFAAELSSGVVTLLIHPFASDLVVHEERGIQVRAGETTRDPRLQNLDLRDRVRLLELEVVDPEGAPVPRGDVHLLGAGTRLGRVERGQARLFVPPGRLDLVVSAPEQRSAVLKGVEASCRVVLGPGLPVLLQIVPEPELSPDYQLQFTLTHQGTGSVQRRVVRPGTELRLALPGPGPYVVAWFLLQRKSPPRKTLPVETPAPQAITVSDSPGEQVFRLALPPEALARAVEQAAGR